MIIKQAFEIINGETLTGTDNGYIVSEKYVNAVRELAKAEHEGLLVVLPCKVRQDCYISNGKGKPAQKITVSRFVYDIWDDEWVVCAANDAGFYMRYAYSTREEAEKALEKEGE